MTETNKGNLPEMAKAKLEEFRRRLMPAGQGGVKPPASNNEPGQVSETETDSVEPAAGEPGRVHDEPAGDDQVGAKPPKALDVAQLDEQVRAGFERFKEAQQGVDAALQGIEAARISHGRTEGSLLAAAIEFGGALQARKAALDKHGKWTETLAALCPDVKHRTALLYMQLWKHRDLIKQKGAVSIRAAQDVVNTVNQLARQIKQQAAEKAEIQQAVDDELAEDDQDQDEDQDDQEGKPLGEPEPEPLSVDRYDGCFRRHHVDAVVGLFRHYRWEPRQIRLVAKELVTMAMSKERQRAVVE
jgi:hypothetical protein